MQQVAKQFAERLNKCLDDLDMPIATRERAVLLGKMLDIPKQQVWAWLEGHTFPDENQMQQIANELEVDLDWLRNNT